MTSTKLELLFLSILLGLISASAQAQDRFVFFDQITAGISSNVLIGKERLAGYQFGLNSRIITKSGVEGKINRVNITSTIRLTHRNFNRSIVPASTTSVEVGIGPELAAGPLRAGIKPLLVYSFASDSDYRTDFRKIYPGLLYEAYFAFVPNFMLGLEGTLYTGPIETLTFSGGSSIRYNLKWIAVGARVGLN